MTSDKDLNWRAKFESDAGFEGPVTTDPCRYIHPTYSGEKLWPVFPFHSPNCQLSRSAKFAPVDFYSWPCSHGLGYCRGLSNMSVCLSSCPPSLLTRIWHLGSPKFQTLCVILKWRVSSNFREIMLLYQLFLTFVPIFGHTFQDNETYELCLNSMKLVIPFHFISWKEENFTRVSWNSWLSCFSAPKGSTSATWQISALW